VEWGGEASRDGYVGKMGMEVLGERGGRGVRNGWSACV